MDAFQEHVSTFLNTIYGSEMKDSLNHCFHLLYNMIDYHSNTIEEISNKIDKLERRRLNGNVSG